MLSWGNKLVGNASLILCNSEYMALAMAGQEADSLRQLQSQMRGEETHVRAMVLFVDSQPAIDCVNNPVYHACTIRILANHHFIRDRAHYEGEWVIRKVDTFDVGADMLIKNATVDGYPR